MLLVFLFVLLLLHCVDVQVVIVLADLALEVEGVETDPLSIIGCPKW